jgi:hypothetical protein
MTGEEETSEGRIFLFSFKHTLLFVIELVDAELVVQNKTLEGVPCLS